MVSICPPVHSLICLTGPGGRRAETGLTAGGGSPQCSRCENNQRFGYYNRQVVKTITAIGSTGILGVAALQGGAQGEQEVARGGLRGTEQKTGVRHRIERSVLLDIADRWSRFSTFSVSEQSNVRPVPDCQVAEYSNALTRSWQHMLTPGAF